MAAPGPDHLGAGPAASWTAVDPTAPPAPWTTTVCPLASFPWSNRACHGFGQFQLVSHDRGARAAHRLVLDHPDAVTRLVILDILPTQSFAT
jgi:pimeloyl-ACP methyl ester carboxylesterase